jgi:hypothetical protein
MLDETRTFQVASQGALHLPKQIQPQHIHREMRSQLRVLLRAQVPKLHRPDAAENQLAGNDRSDG